MAKSLVSLFFLTHGVDCKLIQWLAVKTASEMTYIVSSVALNSTPTNQPLFAE